MKTYLSLGSFVLALLPARALAQQPAACERVEFSEEVLARFPNIRAGLPRRDQQGRPGLRRRKGGPRARDVAAHDGSHQAV